MSKKARQEEIKDINPYELDKLSKIPSWLIIITLKFWAAAAAVFFGAIGIIGLGIDFSNVDETDIIQVLDTDLLIIVILAFLIAILSNYAIKQIVILMNNRRNNTYKYNMINMTGFLAFFVYFFYSIVVSFILYFVTLFLSKYNLVIDLFGTTEGIGIEPITYGFCYVIIDGIFVLCKNVIYNLYQRRKYYKQIRSE